ncbi:MAG: biopolymer transporter ExbD [Bacteroidales bacterium]|nr:biopolymer transporter ExbD [Bacteroidales bacterium]
MAIQHRHKRDSNFSTASMSDLVFLLLIFFILLSTLVSPNAIKLLLPRSESQTMAKQNLTVYINEELQYFVEQTWVDPTDLETAIYEATRSNPSATVVLRSDKTVPIQNVVTVLDAVNRINAYETEKLKVILATAPHE